MCIYVPGVHSFGRHLVDLARHREGKRNVFSIADMGRMKNFAFVRGILIPYYPLWNGRSDEGRCHGVLMTEASPVLNRLTLEGKNRLKEDETSSPGWICH